MIEVVQQRLENYQCKTRLDEINAIKEITQEIALMALSKAEFFKEAEFHGGTALRILYGLPRFSEDLDFALLEPNLNFDLRHYLKHMVEDFQAYGYQVEVADRSKSTTAVQKQFLKVDSLGKLLTLQFPLNRADKKIKIKLEIDTNPPLGATTEIKFLTFPLPFSILAKDKSSSFSGKLHALLCRTFNKGRDWYDFIWYINNKTPVNFTLLGNALKQQGPWKDQTMVLNQQWLIAELTHKITAIKWEDMKDDVRTFLRPNEQFSLDVWGNDFFLSLVDKMKHYL